MYSFSSLIWLSLVITFLPNRSESCCCTVRIFPHLLFNCGCNIFGCNCKPGVCKYHIPGRQCKPASNKVPYDPPENCNDFRYKRSIDSVSFRYSVMVDVLQIIEMQYVIFIKPFQPQNNQTDTTNPAEIFAALDKNESGYITMEEMENSKDYLMSKLV